MKDLMIDIETLGTVPGSVITQIGSCYFDRQTSEIGSTFTVNISIQSCLDVKLQVDENTLRFWYDHKPSWLTETVPLIQALKRLRDFAKQAQCIWSHATFDVPLINAAAAKFPDLTADGRGAVLPYWKCKDIRTLTELAGFQKPKGAKADDKTHDGLEDCYYQVQYCVACFNKLNQGEKKC